MIVWSYYIVDFGALREDLFNEVHEIIRKQCWFTTPEAAQNAAEKDVLARITDNVLDPVHIPTHIEWETEEKTIVMNITGLYKKTYRWGDSDDYGFFVTIYPRMIKSVGWGERIH